MPQHVRDLKKEQSKWEERDRIERENKRLLEKMAMIVSGNRPQPNDARAMFNSSKLLSTTERS